MPLALGRHAILYRYELTSRGSSSHIIKQCRVTGQRSLSFGISGAQKKITFQTSQTPQKVIFSGMQPTGVPHLGNYLGALRPWVQLQNEAAPATQLHYSIVDLHAMISEQNMVELEKSKRKLLAGFLATGLDPERSAIFYQSSVPEHTELAWYLILHAARWGDLSRMTQWKSKLGLPDNVSAFDPAAAKAQLSPGLFLYPVLQAADVLLYGTTHVPVGEDQVQHLEFTRDCVEHFNAIHAEVLVKPETLISRAKRIMSLYDPRFKMSKSDQHERSRIQINDHPDEIAKKVRLAETDSEVGIAYDPDKRPGVSNLLVIFSNLDDQGRSVEELVQIYKATGKKAFKEEVTATIVQSLTETRERYNALMDPGRASYLDEVTYEGYVKARKHAKKTMESIREVFGWVNVDKRARSFWVKEQLHSRTASHSKAVEGLSRRMQDNKELDADSIADLKASVDVELKYHNQCRDALLKMRQSLELQHCNS